MGALEAVYRDAYDRLRARVLLPTRSKDVRVRFYRYAGLKSTIQDRKDHLDVRLSDLLRTAPIDVHQSLAYILLSKLDRRLLVSRAERAPYESWSRTPEATRAHEEARRERGRKHVAPPQGQAHDLALLYHKLNREYFQAMLPPLRVGWSPGRSRSLWGHHDDAHQTIVLNRMLDHPRVPSFVVECILYHEMLHQKHGTRYGRGSKRIIHSRAFRQDERRFLHYEAAQRFLADVSSRRIRL